MIYYARPYSYNPKEATDRYAIEAQRLYNITGHFVICTIPLSCYKMESSDKIEEEVFRLAQSMIEQCTIFIYKGDSAGVTFEKRVAMKSDKPIFEYDHFIENILEEDGGCRGFGNGL